MGPATSPPVANPDLVGDRAGPVRSAEAGLGRAEVLPRELTLKYSGWYSGGFCLDLDLELDLRLSSGLTSPT